jgi:hypothetical protein
LAPELAVTGLIGFLVYSYWYSSFGRKPSERIKVGDQIPEFTVLDIQDNFIALGIPVKVSIERR